LSVETFIDPAEPEIFSTPGSTVKALTEYCWPPSIKLTSDPTDGPVGKVIVSTPPVVSQII